MIFTDFIEVTEFVRFAFIKTLMFSLCAFLMHNFKKFYTDTADVLHICDCLCENPPCSNTNFGLSLDILNLITL